MKVSFDFDDTLDNILVQKYAKKLIAKNIEVWIVTSRLSNEDSINTNWNDDLYSVCKKIGINKNNIYFIPYTDKYKFFLNKQFIWHLDDDIDELKLINKYTNTKGIYVFDNNWKDECNKLLNNI